MTPSIVALVPMKGQSERIPRKNLKPFNGRPLYQWILGVLEAAEAVDRTVVDTDSEEIAEGAASFSSVTTLDRPEELRGGEVPMNDVLLHDVAEVEADVYLQTHCTNPLLRPETVSDAVRSWRDDDADSLFSVTPLKTRLWDEDVTPINHVRDELRPTQDLPPVYEENSNIYVFTRDSIESRGNRIGDDPTIYPMDASEAVDIDVPHDFRVAECLHRYRYGDEPDLDAVV